MERSGEVGVFEQRDKRICRVESLGCLFGLLAEVACTNQKCVARLLIFSLANLPLFKTDSGEASVRKRKFEAIASILDGRGPPN